MNIHEKKTFIENIINSPQTSSHPSTRLGYVIEHFRLPVRRPIVPIFNSNNKQQKKNLYTLATLLNQLFISQQLLFAIFITIYFFALYYNFFFLLLQHNNYFLFFHSILFLYSIFEMISINFF